MPIINKSSKHLNFEVFSPVLGVLAVGVGLCGISLASILFKIEPIAQQANIWNECVMTTQNFLTELPSFEKMDLDELQAMAVNLCNGSTPAQEQDSSSLK